MGLAAFWLLPFLAHRGAQSGSQRLERRKRAGEAVSRFDARRPRGGLARPQLPRGRWRLDRLRGRGGTRPDARRLSTPRRRAVRSGHLREQAPLRGVELGRERDAIDASEVRLPPASGHEVDVAEERDLLTALGGIERV